jgi:hypothetical protein
MKYIDKHQLKLCYFKSFCVVGCASYWLETKWGYLTSPAFNSRTVTWTIAGCIRIAIVIQFKVEYLPSGGGHSGLSLSTTRVKNVSSGLRPSTGVKAMPSSVAFSPGAFAWTFE